MPFCLRLFFSLPLPTGAKSHTRSELLPGFRPRQRFTAFFRHKGLSDQPNKRLNPPYSPAITRNQQRVIISRPSFFRPQTKILSKHPVFSSMDEIFTHFGIFFVCGRKKHICKIYYMSVMPTRYHAPHTLTQKKENCQSAELSSSADPQFSLHEKE